MARWLLLAWLACAGCKSPDVATPPVVRGPPVVGPPSELSFASTSPRSGTRTFSWVDGGVEMTWQARVGKGSQHRRFVPTEQEWNHLWAALDAQSAWASPPEQREDAARVSVHLVVGGRVVDHASRGPSPTVTVVGRALSEMLSRADGGVPVGPEEPESAGEGF